jgi:hypothetical protein
MKSEMIPLKQTHLSFWQKFRELQTKMLWQNTETVQNHMYSSEPLEWPLLSKGIAYWYQKESNVSISTSLITTGDDDIIVLGTNSSPWQYCNLVFCYA